jgi:uncharacterized protein (TIGR03643 family)
MAARTQTSVSLFLCFSVSLFLCFSVPALCAQLPYATFYFCVRSRVKKPNKATTRGPDVLADCYPLEMKNPAKELSEPEVSRVVEMAWEDRTPFEVIEATFGLSEPETIKLMRRTMKPSSFRLWRKRVTGRVTKHRKLRGFDVGRGYCPTQYKR